MILGQCLLYRASFMNCSIELVLNERGGILARILYHLGGCRLYGICFLGGILYNDQLRLECRQRGLRVAILFGRRV